MKTILNISRLSAIALSVTIFCAAQGCARENDDSAMKPNLDGTKAAKPDDLALLKNDDVAWNGTYNGIEPELREPAAKVLKQIAKEYKMGRHETRNRLVALLADPQRFVVAHVLLTQSMYGKKYAIDGTRWNGLEVHLLNNGEAQIDLEQRAGLAAQWKSEMASP